MHYRQDIDGLRAIAILGVVLYHAGLKEMSGGYAGVDVFFVISGFLIGGRILDDLDRDNFSFKDFYLRRARRILPALVAMVLVTMIVGWWTLIPHDYRYMGGAAVTALLSLSNVWFLNRIDYFNPEATLDPLIHTWSLGIEEQFYALIPLLLFLVWRINRKAVLPTLLAIAAASFLVAVATSAEHRLWAFYLLHTRAWELLAGVLIAWSQRNRALPTQFHTPVYLIGLLLVVFGLWAVPPNAPWPGVWTLPAVAGTALVLAAPQATQGLSVLLSNPLMRFMGLISYSLYLWHQPVFGILKKSYFWPQSFLGIAFVCVALIAISTLSWRFVEQPFRTHHNWTWRKRTPFWVAIAAIWMLAIGGGITEGYPKRMSAEVTETLALRISYSPTYRRCLLVRGKVAGYDFADACTFGDTTTVPTVALLGDSHAGRAAQPLGNMLKAQGKGLVELTLSSCLPVVGLINDGQTRAAQCPAFNDSVRAYLDAHPQITQVVVYANWLNYMFDTSGPNIFGHDAGALTIPSLPINGPMPTTTAQREGLFVAALAAQLRWLGQHREVVLVSSTGHLQVDIPRYYANRQWWGTPLPRDANYPRSIEAVHGDRMRSMFVAAIEAAGPLPNIVSLLNADESFCTDAHCDLIRDGAILFSDENHLTLPALDILVPEIVRSLDKTTDSEKH
ncbi:MAG: acyltransferase family protein [Shimia sp.]|uniref:acyltransferase family protein n=1 Tax=Shimia sp. TaxID=1954381 RepID=UPI0040598D36